MSLVEDFGHILKDQSTTSGIVQEVRKGKVTVKTNKGAVITAHNANAGYTKGDRVTLRDGVVVEKISSNDGKTVYLV